MPVSTAPKLGDSATGFAHQAERDKTLVTPAVREKQRRPGETDDDLGQRQDGEQTDQPDDLHRARLPRQQIGEGKADRHADHRDQPARPSEKPSTLPKKAVRKRA